VGMKHLIENERNQYDKATFDVVREKLSQGDLVYDVGAYDAITSVIVSEIVGPSNVVIIEPAEMNWGTIRAYWQKNTAEPPRATFAGFVSDVDTNEAVKDLVFKNSYPPEVNWYPASELEEHSNFRLLNDRGKLAEVTKLPQIRLDTLASVVGPPRGVLIDIEGAEFLALRGAEETIIKHHPTFWISIHPKFMVERFGHTPDVLQRYMKNFGYKATLIADDHEMHWMFE
jgi:FkbM family methyltransferase